MEGSGGRKGDSPPTYMDGPFDTLVAALQADLVGTRQGPGPFTAFAPTDAAFASLSAFTGRPATA